MGHAGCRLPLKDPFKRAEGDVEVAGEVLVRYVQMCVCGLLVCSVCVDNQCCGYCVTGIKCCVQMMAWMSLKCSGVSCKANEFDFKDEVLMWWNTAGEQAHRERAKGLENLTVASAVCAALCTLEDSLVRRMRCLL